MYTYTDSPYEIEDRGTSGNMASEDISIEQSDFFGMGAFKCCKMYNKNWSSETHYSVRESVYPGILYHKAGET